VEPGRTARLRDGTVARFRPITPDDAAALTRLYERLSPESAYQRFFAVMRRLPPDLARILADVDHDRRAAIVATGPDGALIGVARYGALPAADEGEIALVVEDAWQHRGLGTILLSALLDHAASHGITRFVAYVLADNHRMLRLIGRLGLVSERTLDQGVMTLRFTRRPDEDDRRTAPAPASEASG
jgi:RimJ/RimL family protein N-acetyltransferase